MNDGLDQADIEQFLPLPTPTLYILIGLRGGERHGYALMQEVEALSDGTVRMGPGTLYGALKRLHAQGIVTEAAGDGSDKERRRYYRLTPLGQRLCDAEVSRLATLVRRAGRRAPRVRLGEA